MQAPELTLAAAIRDADAKREQARHKAIRNLAPALLLEIGEPGPLWNATERHADGSAVRAALWHALEQSGDTALRAQAALGLGMLGDATLFDRISPWIDLTGDDEASTFQRECAVIAISFVGAASPADDPIRVVVIERLRSALADERPDVRFQAAVALAEVGGTVVERELVAALRTEPHPEVQHNLVDALSRFEDLEPQTAETLVELLEDAEPSDGLSFGIAMVLAGARRAEAAPRLLDALTVGGLRDQALEALAVIADDPPDDAVERVTAVARGYLTPGVTRARAAYALARLCHDHPDDDNPGLRMLDRLAWHPKASVREAVADARDNLRKLAAQR